MNHLIIFFPVETLHSLMRVLIRMQWSIPFFFYNELMHSTISHLKGDM